MYLGLWVHRCSLLLIRFWDQGHNWRRHNRRGKPVEFHLAFVHKIIFTLWKIHKNCYNQNSCFWFKISSKSLLAAPGTTVACGSLLNPLPVFRQLVLKKGREGDWTIAGQRTEGKFAPATLQSFVRIYKLRPLLSCYQIKSNLFATQSRISMNVTW